MVDILNLNYLPEISEFAAQIPRLEDGWWPTGGAVDPAADSGLMNWQAQILGNRTRWLKSIADTLLDASLAPAGYQKLPSGLIVQWGTSAGSSASGAASAVFPIAFPTACLGCLPVDRTMSTSGVNGVSTVGWLPDVTTVTSTIFRVVRATDGTAASGDSVFYLAIGH